MNYFFRLHAQSLRCDQLLQNWGMSLLSLFLRLYIAWQFFKAGLIKIADWQSTLSLFREEYVVPVLPPELAALMGAGGELFFPLLLAVGLFSRPAALGLFMVNAMAVISYPQLWMFECPAAINDHFYWGLCLLVLVLSGPGRFSLDARLSRPR
ncbi:MULTISPECIES: DoxX family protein [unclassified Undibacterium]|uniref:DoxX family protein n=1 Tax=unclassified Undibacterium TaxID=2630295 RepID=UPI002AC8D444|nr:MULTISPECIES: DoxX family protein [unclassified Undibacterium]MEB0139188.1 DoxX family protein [Undibacterium sp. CCC2.1]MEB0172237.1 DoxX family protein [Undibacterium sp. CCC1.1]MEB0175906.1 DoxX family protein [Undibacterium sp. CCC3.4]MEB0215234.1 DoxX family protein [Undibacterium sp. 5I2]WPX43532.1 DoxX family protein [Undibacterium sp. CCC3.4]